MSVGVSFGGSAQFAVGGVLYSLAGTIKITPGGYIRTPAIGPSGPTGNWTEKPESPEVEVEVWDDPASSITALMAATGVTVQLQNRNGKSWVLRNGFCVNNPDVDVVSGKYSIKFSGTSITELPA